MASAAGGLDKLLGRDVPEIAYLKQTNIAQVLSKGLAQTFRVKPNGSRRRRGNLLRANSPSGLAPLSS